MDAHLAADQKLPKLRHCKQLTVVIFRNEIHTQTQAHTSTLHYSLSLTPSSTAPTANMLINTSFCMQKLQSLTAAAVTSTTATTMTI